MQVGDHVCLIKMQLCQNALLRLKPCLIATQNSIRSFTVGSNESKKEAAELLSHLNILSDRCVGENKFMEKL